MIKVTSTVILKKEEILLTKIAGVLYSTKQNVVVLCLESNSSSLHPYFTAIRLVPSLGISYATYVKSEFEVFIGEIKIVSEQQ